jgi:predicted nucleic acid-binding protein
MTYSSCLDQNFAPLVLDTSVLINLHASDDGPRILSAIPNRMLVPAVVASELEHETGKRNGDHDFFLNQIAVGKVELAALSPAEWEIFERLISGTCPLGDGEAATIAVSTCRGMAPVIDERRGRAKAQEMQQLIKPIWSLDLFSHHRVVAALGETAMADALYLALRFGRMRVHSEHCESVVKIIGVRRALDCKSLPDFKNRQLIWRDLIRAELTLNG